MKTPYDDIKNDDEKASNTHIIDMTTEEVEHLSYLWERANFGVQVKLASDALIAKAIEKKSDFGMHVHSEDGPVFEITVKLKEES